MVVCVSGHDYTGEFGQAVSEAVKEFARAHRRQFCVVDENVTGSWYLLKSAW